MQEAKAAGVHVAEVSASLTLAHDIVNGMIEGLVAMDGDYPREAPQQSEDASDTSKRRRTGVARDSHLQHPQTERRLLTVSDLKIVYGHQPPGRASREAANGMSGPSF